MLKTEIEAALMNNLGWIGVGIGLVYWFMEDFAEIFIFHEGVFMVRLLHPGGHELWMRSTVEILIISFGFISQASIRRLRKSKDRVMKMNHCFLLFESDPLQNIKRLTALCGEIMGASAAFYNRLEAGKLYSWGQWNAPTEMYTGEKPQGHICYDVIQNESNEVVIIPDLPKSSYAAGDPLTVCCGMRTYVGKAVRLAETVVGSLCVYYHDDHFPDEEDVQSMGIIASAISVEEARNHALWALRDSEERLRYLSCELLNVSESERKRIAQQMHDAIGQSLSALKYTIEESLETLVREVDEQKVKPLRRSIPLIREIVNEVRSLQEDLWPAILDDLGIIAAVESVCEQFNDIYQTPRAETQIEIREDDIPKPLKIVIYRILQEALSNAAKHSKSEVVQVSLRRAGNAIHLVVQDNGSGFDVQQALSPSFRKGLGLTSMRERAELSNGSFTVRSKKGKGTAITVTWPIEEKPINS